MVGGALSLSLGPEGHGLHPAEPSTSLPFARVTDTVSVFPDCSFCEHPWKAGREQNLEQEPSEGQGARRELSPDTSAT